MRKSSFLILLISTLFIACTEPPTGIAHAGLKQAYPYTSYGTNVYSESMIRAALNLANADSANEISSKTYYVLTFEMDKNARWRNSKEDSILRHHISQSDAELLADYSQKDIRMTLYGLISGNTINDLMLIDNSAETFKVYEYVGEMPLQTLMKTGFNNFDEIRKIIIPPKNAGTDSTDI